MSSNSIDADNYKMIRTGKPVRAIFSDYDGTLCSAMAVRDNSLGQNRIPPKIKEELLKISKQIPICIISSKEYFFLKETTTFARVISCLMGIEMVSFARNEEVDGTTTTTEQSPKFSRKLLANESQLLPNSDALEEIAQSIESDSEFGSLIVERKYTSDRRILAGITVDWRYAKNWDHFRKSVLRFISATLTNISQTPEPVNLYLQGYDFHPFVDVYAIKCSKDTGFDVALSEISSEISDIREYRKNNITAEHVLYLGDSENDNPAFLKAGISIGIRSDPRLNPKLDCSYFIKYKQLSSFLTRLRNNEYLFNEELLREAKLE
ncbi:MAG: hypothetical protein M3247_08305 [Thermoproteota archaeon]|nr:hypothetical protein [Thermoproteota archaeon]